MLAHSKKLFSLLLCITLFGQASAMTDALVMTGRSVISPESLGKVTLLFKDGAYSAVRNGVTQSINLFDVSPILRAANTAKLITLVKAGGALALTKMSNGDLRLALAPCLKGGGPISGAIGYWTVKALAYGGFVAATGTLAVGTGGLAVATAMGTTAIVSGSAITTGVGVVAAGITQAGLAGEAALITTGVVTSAGGYVGAMAAVETAATGTFMALTACPFLP